MIKQLSSVSKFKLTKLLYLLDWQEVRANGNVPTGCYYIFQKDGPLATGLTRTLEEMENHEVSLHFKRKSPIYAVGDDVRYDMHLPEEVVAKIDQLVAQCRQLTDVEMKTKVYLTEPMKRILRRQRQGEKMLNHPVFEGWIKADSEKYRKLEGEDKLK